MRGFLVVTNFIFQIPSKNDKAVNQPVPLLCSQCYAFCLASVVKLAGTDQPNSANFTNGSLTAQSFSFI